MKHNNNAYTLLLLQSIKVASHGRCARKCTDMYVNTRRKRVLGNAIRYVCILLATCGVQTEIPILARTVVNFRLYEVFQFSRASKLDREKVEEERNSCYQIHGIELTSILVRNVIIKRVI